VPVEPIAEFGFSGAHHKVNDIIREFLGKREVSIVEIDTRLDTNFTGQRSSSEVESLIAKMDVIITTRLHGMVFAIKNGVPPIVIDPHMEPAKVMCQANTIGWPVKFTASELTEEKLSQAFDYCLTDEAKEITMQCSVNAKEKLVKILPDFLESVSNP
jgi:polysaccharide pyruvyl transferase WcaK-like protein